MKNKKNVPLDPDFAPEGCKAVEVNPKKTGCSGCLYEGVGRCGFDLKCTPPERPDGKAVIFERKG